MRVAESPTQMVCELTVTVGRGFTVKLALLDGVLTALATTTV